MQLRYEKRSYLFLFGKLFHLNGVFLNLDLLVPVTALVSLTGAFLCSALTESDYCGSKQTVPIWFAYT